jgi:hypothetical protein
LLTQQVVVGAMAQLAALVTQVVALAAALVVKPLI